MITRILITIFILNSLSACSTPPQLYNTTLLGNEIKNEFEDRGYFSPESLDNWPKPIFPKQFPKDPPWKGKIEPEDVEVEIAIYIDKFGIVKDVEILYSKYSLVGNYVKDAAFSWKFEKGLINDKPVRFYLRLSIEMQLE